jgi:hypothetical protein
MASTGVQVSPRENGSRSDVLRTPEVAAMLELRRRGWGIKRIAGELGCNPRTVRRYDRRCRGGHLDGLQDWLAERFRQHHDNADVVRQDLLREHGIAVSLRTVERAVAPLRRELRAQTLANVRFETPPGKQLQIDFDERRTWIAGEPTKVFLFVTTLRHSRRTNVQAFRHERQSPWFAGLEAAFRYFGGVPQEVLFGNARALVTHLERHDPFGDWTSQSVAGLAATWRWGRIPADTGGTGSSSQAFVQLGPKRFRLRMTPPTAYPTHLRCPYLCVRPGKEAVSGGLHVTSAATSLAGSSLARPSGTVEMTAETVFSP